MAGFKKAKLIFGFFSTNAGSRQRNYKKYLHAMIYKMLKDKNANISPGPSVLLLLMV